MIKCIYPTTAKKLGVIAATYRSGPLSLYGTCPSYCNLLPKPKEGTNKIDWDYLKLEYSAVPRSGQAWSYTHFNHQLITPKEFGTVLNISTDTTNTAIQAILAGHPTVYAAPITDTQWPRKINNIQFIRCPAETNQQITCQTCGGGTPLCARRNRNYIIVFVAHGTSKQLVGNPKPGGCYASTGHCLQQWRSTLNAKGSTTWDETQDPNRLLAWVQSLPQKTLLRHRISGDIGL